MQQQGMLNIGQLEAFLRRYAAIFGLGFMLCMISIALGTVSWVDAFWHHRPKQIQYTFITGGLLVLTLSVGQIAMFRGLRWGIWPIVATLLVPLFMATSQLGATRYPILQAIALAAPLLGLLVLNSKRHREMRRRLAELRARRAAGTEVSMEDFDHFPDNKGYAPQSKPWLLITLCALGMLLVAAKFYWRVVEHGGQAPVARQAAARTLPETPEIEVILPRASQESTRTQIDAALKVPGTLTRD